MGAAVGAKLGRAVGAKDGTNVGPRLGAAVGRSDGIGDGARVGAAVGARLGWAVGSHVGLSVGSVHPHDPPNCIRNVVFRRASFAYPFKAIYVKTNSGEEGTGIVSNVSCE